MTTAATRFLLQRNALFCDLPDDALEKIIRLTHRRHFAKGTTVFHQGDPGDALYGVVTGAVRLSNSSAGAAEVFLNIMEPGDSFGEIALLDGQPRTATAVAIDDTDLMVIQRNPFLELLKDEHELTMQLLELCCKRVRWISEIIEDSAFLSSEARLAKRLMSLARMHGTQSPEGMRLKINQADLANFLNTSRQFVNQNLQAWQKAGAIKVGRGSVTIVDAEALQRVTETDEDAAG